jgi:glycosyltransferase involved in cell wall biosynthesis
LATLSAIVITKNEAENIAECLESLSFVDEIVVIDSGSKDGTEEIARQFTNKVYITEWKGYAGAKQHALDQCTGEWIFWLDADERVTPELAEEMKSAICQEFSFSGYMMPRKAYFLGRWIRHGGWYPGYVIRLFRRGCGTFSQERVHERLMVNGPIGALEEPLLHYTDRSINHYFNKLNMYTSLAAEDLKGKDRKTSVLDLIVRPIHWFVRMYILRAGFLDGVQGFLLAVFSSSYVFTKYAKLWELRRDE